jgi:hypothetical protein
MSVIGKEYGDPRIILERARSACRTFAAMKPSDCPAELAAQLYSSVDELLRLSERLLAETDQFRSRLHRTTTFSVPDNSGTSAAL